MSETHPTVPDVTHHFADVNGVRLHYVSAGSGPLIILLHGFPEFWYTWREQLRDLSRDHHVVAVDLRGFNLSDKPADVEAYRPATVAEDIPALADDLGVQGFVLVGHDWGGAVAWAAARAHPERIEKLVIINSPHPVLFRKALTTNPGQQKASAYMAAFRLPGAEQMLAANSYKSLVDTVFDGVSPSDVTYAADRQAYVDAWSQPGALTGGLNYYRAAALPPSSAAPADFTIRVPTLVLWGERDRYLLTDLLDGLEHLVPDLTLRRVPDASHWIMREKPAFVNAEIRRFLQDS